MAAAPQEEVIDLFQSIRQAMRNNDDFERVEALILENGILRPEINIHQMYEIELPDGQRRQGDLMHLAVIENAPRSYASLLAASEIEDQQPYANLAAEFQMADMYEVITEHELPHAAAGLAPGR